ncbi:MAG: amidohydrolase family protein [candidate division Zixibacteria bacterium]|nr:amidohydrolase family protein [candidate division Zixibacteria bacterium]
MGKAFFNCAGLALLLYVPVMPLSQVLSQAGVDGGRPPIIDMHLHAFRLDDGKPLPLNPVTGRPSAARTSAEVRDSSLAVLERYNIVKAVVSGPPETVDQWREAAPDRIIVGVHVDEANPLPDLARLRVEIQAGRVHVLGELALQYRGMAPNDPRLEPYYALAEELDIPIAIHTGIGPPGTPYDPCCPDFRVTFGNPILVEEVLIHHPRLRIYLMHGGAPYLQETEAVLSVYPQVYVDLATINWILPREEFHGYLRELMRAGFGKRLLFGSDQMVWPEAIGMAVEGIESATFLTEEEKRDIFYNNAVRFLKLDGK